MGYQIEKQWYVVNTYSSHENKVKENLEKRTGKEISADVLYTTCAEALKESKDPGTVQVVNRILENMREKENV